MCDWITEKSEKLEMDDLAKDLTTVKELQSKSILLFFPLRVSRGVSKHFFYGLLPYMVKKDVASSFFKVIKITFELIVFARRCNASTRALNASWRLSKTRSGK